MYIEKKIHDPQGCQKPIAARVIPTRVSAFLVPSMCQPAHVCVRVTTQCNFTLHVASEWRLGSLAWENHVLKYFDAPSIDNTESSDIAKICYGVDVGFANGVESTKREIEHCSHNGYGHVFRPHQVMGQYVETMFSKVPGKMHPTCFRKSSLGHDRDKAEITQKLALPQASLVPIYCGGA